MPTGHFSGYTGDTLVHLANGKRKYMRDLEPGDEILTHGSNTRAVVSHIIQYEYDGFISQVTNGINTTRYTIYQNLQTGADTTPIIASCPTIYYNGTIYNFSCQNIMTTPSLDTNPQSQNPTHVFIMGTNPTVSKIGMYDINKHPYNTELIRAIKSYNNNSSDQTFYNLPGIWYDPPGKITQRHPKNTTI